MIGRLTGTILEYSPNEVLLDVAGVGYALQIPLSTFYAISGGNGSGKRASLHVHTHVREDTLQLYGFAELRERAVFEQLIAISGVGPRLALAILSGIGVAELGSAVERQDRERLQKIPGVGRKTAERLLLELRDRLARSGLAATADPAVRPSSGQREAATPRGDAISALVNLGYRPDPAARAVDRARDALGPSADLEALLKAALGGIVG